MIRRLLREPLLHFLLAGGALFALYSAVAPAAPDATRRVELSEALVDGLRKQHTLQTGRPPDAEALDRLVEQHVEREILYREARALGLDQGDPIVRRRLVQKMGFLLEDRPIPAPDDATLTAWLETHADRFAQPARLTFRHVFVPSGDAAEAARLAQSLASGAPPETLGAPFVHGAELRGRTSRQLAALMGQPFADAVSALEPGAWSAPIRSSHGLHLARVEGRVAGRVPALAEVRARVLADWTEAQRAELKQRAIEALRGDYEVVRP